MENKFVRIMIKLDRISSWTLLFVIILFAISGFGMTKGIISYSVATNLHFNILAPIGLIAFLIHTGWGIHLSFIRWGIWNKITKTLLITIYVLIALAFIYVDYIYQSSQAPITYLNIQRKTATLNLGEDTTSTSIKVFTLEELNKYNGKNGQPSYVAVDNIVYDASSVFRNGMHNGAQAGNDLTKEFHQQHKAEILKKLRVIGVLRD